MNTAAVGGKLPSTGSVSGSTRVASDGSESGKLSGDGSINTNVLTRKAEVMEDMEDISLSGNANTYVLRYNKSDDTYKSDKRNLDGGSF